MSQRILVTGASGHLGRRVIENLLDMNIGSIVAATRTPELITDLAHRGVEVKFADFDKPETLDSAFADVERMLLISTDAVYVPGQRLRQHKAAISSAQKAGVGHIVYTSLPSPRPGSESIVEDDHFWTEHEIASSSMSWTFMRHALYTDNLLWVLPQAVTSGMMATGTANTGRHSVSREDCARADAAVLASTDTRCRIYEITGPAAVTAAEVAAMVSELTGKTVSHMPIDFSALHGSLTNSGLPSTLVDAMVGFDRATAQGFHSSITNSIEELTGQAPESVFDFLCRNSAALKAEISES